MKMIKFRVKNYKSIVDSGDCYFSEKLTILAGKNESGKTSVLEALEDFKQGSVIRTDAKPINGNGKSEISITFSLSADEVNEILKSIGSKKGVSEELIISISKNEDSSTYLLDNESQSNINLFSESENIVKQIKDLVRKITKSLSETQSVIELPKLADQGLNSYIEELTNFKTQYPELNEINNEIDSIGKLVESHNSQENISKSFIDEFIKLKLPNFILFSSFEHEFPKSMPIDSLNTNEWAQDLEKVSNFSIAKISSVNEQEQQQHENSVNIDFSDKFNKYWTQDSIKLQIKKDGLDIKFWIIENDVPYYPSQRSKGQQWYLSFYIKIVAKLQDDKPNVILIDEPGLYLHAKAQKDLLNVLLTYTKENPVLFSTHSPYLITEDNLECIRLIEKGRDGTKILGKIHAHPTADKETLTPILTAIGLGINDSISAMDQKHNVVVEGPEDTFYLRAFKELVKDKLKLNFVCGGGATNMGLVGSILEGWGSNVYYLYDNDQGKKDGWKSLKAWKVLVDSIKTVLQTENSTIVDIFDKQDFKTYVLNDSTLDYSCSNSEYIKSLKPRPDKVLLARKFLQKVRSDKENIKLEKLTKDNVIALFKVIEFN